MDGQLTDGNDRDPVRVETVVIGAGQAGLSAGHHLARRGREFVILDPGRRMGDNWRSHWDSVRHLCARPPADRSPERLLKRA